MNPLLALAQRIASWLVKVFGQSSPAVVAGQEPSAVPALPPALAPEASQAAAPPSQGTTGLSPEALQAIMPHLPASKLDLYLPLLAAGMAEFAIDTPLRAAAFVAQLAHESSELREWSENLNYSAAALLTAFPTHFDAATAAAYARQPQLIANRVYANRMGNGAEESGDGWRNRGRGPIALTGADNYREYGAALGVDLVGNPDLAATPAVGFRIAGRYFAVNGCNELADAGDFTTITRRINGGLNGLADREMYYTKAKEVLGA
jgi:putative chitinase